MKRLTDAAYWEENWWSGARPQKLWLYRDFDFETVRLLGQCCQQARSETKTESLLMLEMGAGGSRVLPYVGRRFNCKVVGSDFSPSGCRLLNLNLALKGLPPAAIREDLFQSSLPDGVFDVVYSSGLIEHFDDTRAVIAEHLRVLKPGGRLALMVPNLEGIQGKIWKRLAYPLWLRHRVFGPEFLASQLRAMGLSDVRSGYLGSFFIQIGYGSDWTGLAGLPPWLARSIHAGVRISNGLISLAFRLSPVRPHTRLLSPAFAAAGIKLGDSRR